MIKKKLIAVRDWMEDSLRSLLGQVTTKGRIIIILTMLFVFSFGAIYITVYSTYNEGKKSGRQMQIKHIKGVELDYRQKTDSINHKNDFKYE